MNCSDRRVVVTADDGGQCLAWDEAIIDAYQRGVVSAVSLVANGPSYPSMVEKLRAQPRLGVGVHLNLYDGTPLCAVCSVRTALGPDGRFLGEVGPIVFRYTAGRLDLSEVEREWATQIERIVQDGIVPTHLSSHYHLHMLPGLFDVVARLAEQYSVGWVRAVDEPPWWFVAAPRALAKTALLWCLAGWNRRRSGCRTLLCTRGIAHSGQLGVHAWRRLVARLPDGPVEILCHPGQSEGQTRALLSTEVGRALRSRRRIVSFDDLGRPS